MARIVKEENYTARRNEILDATQRFVYSKGFELMTIQDILDDLHISKGAFYHYFDSKGAVLEALVERMIDKELLPLITPIVQDSNLSALEKLQGYIDTAVRWKTEQKDLMLSLIRIWYADENAVFREKVFATSVKRITPLLTEIIRQGVREGALTTPYPNHACQMIMYLLQGQGNVFVELLLLNEAEENSLNCAKESVAAYTDALERILGAPKDSINLIDDQSLQEWFISQTINLS
jgi:AcrR family transcriptional regulator